MYEGEGGVLKSNGRFCFWEATATDVTTDGDGVGRSVKSFSIPSPIYGLVELCVVNMGWRGVLREIEKCGSADVDERAIGGLKSVAFSIRGIVFSC